MINKDDIFKFLLCRVTVILNKSLYRKSFYYLKRGQRERLKYLLGGVVISFKIFLSLIPASGLKEEHKHLNRNYQVINIRHIAAFAEWCGLYGQLSILE